MRTGGPARCTIFEIHPFLIDPSIEEDDVFLCEMDPKFNNGQLGILFNLEGLDDSFYNNVKSGKTIITANNAIRRPDSITSPVGGTLVLDPKDVHIEPELEPLPELTVSMRPMLILYTIGLDHSNSYRTSDEQADNVFGMNGDPANLKSQIDWMSKNQMQYIPACSRPEDACFNNANIINGVMECDIQQNIAGISYASVGNWNVDYANNILNPLGLSTSDFHLFHVIPEEANFGGGAAWGQVPGTVTWYRDSYAYRVGVQVHEIGHNLNMRHSGHGSLSYGDHSCSLGNPSYGDDGPLVGWNGQKAWQTGWYSNDSQEVDVSNGQFFNGLLIGIGDYVEDRYTPDMHKIVLRVPEPSRGSNFAYFLSFNRREGPNAGVSFNADKLIIVESTSNTSQSWTTAFLDMNSNKFQRTNFNGSGKTLNIDVCHISFVDNNVGPDTVRVLVYLDNELSCDNLESPSATPSITMRPTPISSKEPTNSPSISPSPTKTPTQKPVKTRPTRPPKGAEKPTKPPKKTGPPVQKPTRKPKKGKTQEGTDKE